MFTPINRWSINYISLKSHLTNELTEDDRATIPPTLETGKSTLETGKSTLEMPKEMFS